MTDTNTATTAATDLLGASLSPPEPPTPAYFINPGSAGYVDQTGHLRATLSTEQLATARADWLDAFDRRPRTRDFRVATCRNTALSSARPGLRNSTQRL